MTSILPVFRHADWTRVADGRSEATATPHDCQGRPPYEAVAWIWGEWWHWELFWPDPDDANSLDTVAQGFAYTLADAKRQADHHARSHRDLPKPDRARPAWQPDLSDHSIVTCDSCGSRHRLGQLVTTGAGRCLVDRGDGSLCYSTSFNGHTPDELTLTATTDQPPPACTSTEPHR